MLADSVITLLSMFAVRFFRFILSMTRVTPGIIKKTGCATVSLCWKQNEVGDLLGTEPHLLLLHFPLWFDEVWWRFYGRPTKPRWVGWLFSWRADTLWSFVGACVPLSWKSNDAKRIWITASSFCPLVLKGSYCERTGVAQEETWEGLSWVLIKTNRGILNKALVSSSELEDGEDRGCLQINPLTALINQLTHSCLMKRLINSWVKGDVSYKETRWEESTF